MSEIKIGDKVHLKSGGPVMTVSDIDDYSGKGTEDAMCVWFDGNKPQQQTFDLRTLEIQKDEQISMGMKA